jgi:flavin reductase (DIM6/NTAB) family NADH-FMN oxidoreductase RutF
MSREIFKPGTFLYPIPAVLVTCGNMDNSNVLTIAWTGIISSDKPMTYISVRKERHSYNILKENMEFVINLTNKDLVYATDYCGVRSGAKENKFEKLGLIKEKANIVKCPLIKQSPVCIECKVTEIKEMGSHDMFIAEIVSVNVDKKYIDESNKFDMEKCDIIAYSHGAYYTLGEKLGKFGFSVKK